jgi:kumamolisin
MLAPAGANFIRSRSDDSGTALMSLSGQYEGKGWRAQACDSAAPAEFDRRVVTALQASAEGLGLRPTEIARSYGLSGIDAQGTCLGIISLGGGYNPDDLNCASDLMGQPRVSVSHIPINGNFNDFQNGTSTFDIELALDMQIVAGIVPKASIVVYFSSTKPSDIAAAIRIAAKDTENNPDVLSLSWGASEDSWQDGDRNDIEGAMETAAARNVSFVVAAGDSLATGGIFDGRPHVFFPASSPFAIACGGTDGLVGANGVSAGDETVWNEGTAGTTGGFSNSFAVPDYQKSIQLPQTGGGLPGRGVPDLAAAAGSNPGYRIVLNGTEQKQKGTSAATPLWAAVIAMACAKRGRRLGAFHKFLYENPLMCREIITGNNRCRGVGYYAGPGWNACTGLGVPKGATTVQRLAEMP